ncbi:MAG: HAD-IIA family hydrolase, partial [Angustibacter sp.]
DQVVTSALAAARVVAQQVPPGSSVLVTGGEGLREAIEGMGLQPAERFDSTVAAVVQGFSPDIGWSQLTEACLAITSGALWVAANPDLTLPIERGLAPGNGAFVQALRSATRAEPQVAGKPCRPIFDEAVQRAGRDQVLVVGDRLDTDIAGAHAAGLPAAFVLTGVHGVDDVLRAPATQRPDILGGSLTDLLIPCPTPRLTDDGWAGRVVPAVRWRRRGPDWQLEKPAAVNDDDQRQIALEAVRTACAVVWEQVDAIAAQLPASSSSDDQDTSTEQVLDGVISQLEPIAAPWGWMRERAR